MAQVTQSLVVFLGPYIHDILGVVPSTLEPLYSTKICIYNIHYIHIYIYVCVLLTWNLNPTTRPKPQTLMCASLHDNPHILITKTQCCKQEWSPLLFAADCSLLSAFLAEGALWTAKCGCL